MAELAETVHLSDAAIALLRFHAGREGGLSADDSSRELYRELEAAGLVILSRPFTGPRSYLLTKVGWKLIDVLARMDANVPSPGESVSRRP
jgi:hypothetical protein